MKPTERFSDRVRDYVRYRPRYPAGVVAVLREAVGLTPDLVVADIGAGTGFSAELFLDHGNVVYAVEPNREMREAAETLLAGRPRFRSVAGTAEATTLDAGCADLVVAAQAFHWFEPEEAAAEFGRILRPDGWVVLLWNTRRMDTPFLREYERLLVRHGTDYDRVRHDHIDPGAVTRFLARDYMQRRVDHAQVLDLESFKGRLLSASYVPSAGEPGHEAMVEGAERLFARYEAGGRVRLEYHTEIHVGRLPGGEAGHG